MSMSFKTVPYVHKKTGVAFATPVYLGHEITFKKATSRSCRKDCTVRKWGPVSKIRCT